MNRAVRCLLWKVALCAQVAAAHPNAAPATDTATVAYVNGEPVAAGEVRMQMRRIRAEVFDYFSRTYGAKDSPGFGSRRFGGESPATVLRDRALDSCVRIKTEQMIARNEGIIDRTDFRTFLREFDMVNSRRFRTVVEGGIIYGPVTYHLDSYFSYVYSNMMIDLRKKILARMTFDDASLRQGFPRYRASVSGKSPACEVLFVHGKGANARAVLERLRPALQKDASCGTSRLASAGVDCERLRLERITRELIGQYGRATAGRLLDTARTLAPGNTSMVFEGENGGFCLVKCLRVCDVSDASFAENREKIREFLKEDTFRSVIDERCRNASLRTVPQELNALLAW